MTGITQGELYRKTWEHARFIRSNPPRRETRIESADELHSLCELVQWLGSNEVK